MLYPVDDDDNDADTEGRREVFELAKGVRGRLMRRDFLGELKQSAVGQGEGLPDVEGAN